MELAFWEALDILVKDAEIVIDRPKGTIHFGNEYEFNYGYIVNTTSTDKEEIDVWQKNYENREVVGIICTVDLLKKDAEIKILLGFNDEEIEKIRHFHNTYESMKGIVVKRNR